MKKNDVPRATDTARTLTDERFRNVASANQEWAIKAILNERKQQDKKWGIQNHTPIVWSAVLTEECGEFAEAALRYRFNHATPTTVRQLREEAIQCAAVALAIIECLERDEMGTGDE